VPDNWNVTSRRLLAAARDPRHVWRVCGNAKAYLGGTMSGSGYSCMLALMMTMPWVSFPQVCNLLKFIPFYVTCMRQGAQFM
jgi:hypothetical protein